MGLMAAIYILIHGVQTKSTKSKGSDKDLQDSNYLRRDLWSLWRMKWDQPHNLMRGGANFIGCAFLYYCSTCRLMSGSCSQQTAGLETRIPQLHCLLLPHRK